MFHSGGLLVGKTLSDENINYQPGSRWDPKSSASNWLHARYDPLLPVFQELKKVLVCVFNYHPFLDYP